MTIWQYHKENIPTSHIIRYNSSTTSNQPITWQQVRHEHCQDCDDRYSWTQMQRKTQVNVSTPQNQFLIQQAAEVKTKKNKKQIKLQTQANE